MFRNFKRTCLHRVGDVTITYHEATWLGKKLGHESYWEANVVPPTGRTHDREWIGNHNRFTALKLLRFEGVFTDMMVVITMLDEKKVDVRVEGDPQRNGQSYYYTLTADGKKGEFTLLENEL